MFTRLAAVVVPVTQGDENWTNWINAAWQSAYCPALLVPIAGPGDPGWPSGISGLVRLVCESTIVAVDEFTPKMFVRRVVVDEVTTWPTMLASKKSIDALNRPPKKSSFS